MILNPIKVPDPDEFRSKVDAALTERGFDDSLWLETTEDDAGETMAERAVQETVDLSASVDPSALLVRVP